MTTYPLVRGLERGLTVLQTLSSLGEATALQLAQQTGLPRPTVHRLLQTLRRTGYVIPQLKKGTFRLSVRVRALAEGCRDDDWISEIAGPVLEKLCDSVVWPTDIATHENGAMIVRLTTENRSPLTIDRLVYGRRVRLIGSALGSAYLAFCSEAQRQTALQALKRLPDAEKVADPVRLQQDISVTRRRGYGLRIRGLQPKTSSIAVPVMHGDLILACININWIDSALRTEEAIRRYLQPLRRAAKAISISYANR